MSATAKCLACGETFAWFASGGRIAPRAILLRADKSGTVAGVLLDVDERDVITSRTGVCAPCVTRLVAQSGAGFKAVLEAERVAEREACAKIIERYRHSAATDLATKITADVAAQIRKRGTP